LHIHGGGQTASLDWVKFWTKRGYVCATFDFCGPWADRTEVTEWGPIKHANMAQAAGGYQVDPTPRESSWYHWTVASRRAITLLASDPRVDAQRIGIFGISMGGTLTWMVAGSDPRVKAAAPIYGCGYNFDRRKTRFGYGDVPPTQTIFQRTASSEAHAPYVTCPVLFLDSTNDFHGWMDDAYLTLGVLQSPHWQAFTPRYNHHIAPEQGANLPLFMDAQLKGGPALPASPTLRVTLNAEGVPQGTVVQDAIAQKATPIEKVDVYYSFGDKAPPTRYWRRAATTGEKGSWLGALPVVDPWETVVAFANVSYTGGACLSTNLVRVIPGQLGKARATLVAGEPLDPQLAAESWYYLTAYTDPNIAKRMLLVEATPDHGPAVLLNPEVFGNVKRVNIGTHVLGDPQFAGQEGAVLGLDWKGTIEPPGLSASVKAKDFTPLAKSYSTTVTPEELSPEWGTIKLTLDRFKTPEGASPASWRELDVLQIQGVSKDEGLRVGNLRWLPAEKKP